MLLFPGRLSALQTGCASNAMTLPVKERGMRSATVSGYMPKPAQNMEIAGQIVKGTRHGHCRTVPIINKSVDAVSAATRLKRKLAA